MSIGRNIAVCAFTCHRLLTNRRVQKPGERRPLFDGPVNRRAQHRRGGDSAGR